MNRQISQLNKQLQRDNLAPNAKVRSFNYDRLLMLGPLTDRRIHQYALRGRYGDRAQQLAQKADHRPKRQNKPRPNLDRYL